MATGLTYEIEDGTATTLAEIIDNLIQGFVFDFRDGTRLRTVEEVTKDADADIAREQKQLDEALADIHELEGKSDAQLEAENLAAWEARVAEAAKDEASRDEKRARYEAALVKLIAWEPPPALLNLKTGFIRHMREAMSHCNYGLPVGPKPSEHGSALREKERGWRREQYGYRLNDLKKAQDRKAENVAFYTALHAELERVKEQG